MNDKKYFSLDSSILFRCNQKYFDKILAKYDIGYTQMLLLIEIYENEGISMNELAIKGVFDKGTITKSIQRLEEKNYVRIDVGEIDKRTRLLHSSEKALEIINELYNLRFAWFNYLFEGIEEEEINVFYGTLAKILDKAKTYASIENEENNDLKIYGFQKLTLLDYPSKMASTIFTGGCNFKCPFCHNRSLVFLNENNQEIAKEDILEYLQKRSSVLDGVCISGGEPLLHKKIKDFIKAIKTLGLSIKLDTNGSQFDLLKELVEEGLIDYVAMDIKNCPKKYPMTIGVDGYDIEEVKKSVSYLLEGHVDYEFRTTVVAKFHEIADFKEIGEWIKGAKRYYLQNFEDHGTCVEEGLSALDKESLKMIKEVVKDYVSFVAIRGMED